MLIRGSSKALTLAVSAKSGYLVSAPISSSASALLAQQKMDNPWWAPPPGTKYGDNPFHHSDYRAPDFDPYLKHALKDPRNSSVESDGERKFLPYTAGVAALGSFLFYGKHALHTIVNVKMPWKDACYAASTEVNLADVPLGQTKSFVWRGSPVFVRHRTQAEIDTESKVNVGELRHPETDTDRIQKPEWLVVIGVCTHLGCIPISNKGAYNGWFCPCHGSHYDMSGRIRKGPAPLNLEVPPYKFVGDSTLMIG